MENVLTLYTYIDGVNDTPFPNVENQVVISSFRYESKRMGVAPSLSCTIMHKLCLDKLWSDNVYAVFNGEKYFIKQIPSSSYSNNDSRYKHEVTFVSERSILDGVYVYDVVDADYENDKPVSNSSKFSFYGTINEFAERLNQSLAYSNVGYTIVVDDGITSEGKLLSFDDKYFSEALQEIYNTFDIPYYFVGKVIHIGYTNNAITHTFKYGADESLLSIQKTNANFKTTNRVTGIGSQDNIPYYYPNRSEKGETNALYNGSTDNVQIVDSKKYDKLYLSDKLTYSHIAPKTTIPFEKKDYRSLDYNLRAYNQKQIILTYFITLYEDQVLTFEQDLRGQETWNKADIYGVDNDFHESIYGKYTKTLKTGQYKIVIDDIATIYIEDTSDDKWVETVIDDYFSIEVSLTTLEKYGWSLNGEMVDLKDYGLSVLKSPNINDVITFERTNYIAPKQYLMPPIYRESLGKERFYNALNNEYQDGNGGYYEFDNPYVDGKPKEQIVSFEHIKPSIVGATNANGERIDMFVEFAYDENDNDETKIIEVEEQYSHPYFFAKLRKFNGQFGFNLFDQAIDEGEMTISMTSGSCGACNFVIFVNENNKNTVQVDALGRLMRDKDGNVLFGEPQDKQNDTINNEVWVALQKDIDTFGVVMPNASNNYKPSSNDTFVILHIDLPYAYIEQAEDKLKDEIIKYMSLNNSEKFTFSITFSRIFFAENPSILAQLNENARIQIEYDGNTYELYISSYSYVVDSNSSLPEIKVELSDTLTIVQNSLQQAISKVKEDILSNTSSVDVLKVGLRHFLRKNVDDRSRGIIASDKQVEVGRFTEGILGAGGALYMREGNSYGEVDFLKVRKKATFSEITVQELKHVGGEIILSSAAMICSEVEELTNGWKCYFNNKDSEGREIYNEFEAGDQARCQTFNLTKRVDGMLGNHYYWRLVTEAKDNYIILSKTDCDVNSDAPMVGDNISLLGNRDKAERQSAIVLSAYGSDAPSYKQYRGINSYSLEGKQVTKLSPFGNELTGKLVLEAGSTGWENLTGLKDVVNKQSSDLESFASSVTKEFENIRNEMDGAIDTWFGEEEPTLDNYPANEWAENSDKDSHLGDLYYSNNGKAYRFQYTESDGYHWMAIEDSEVVKALELAQKAFDTADKKRTIFIKQPEPPYDLGDLWAGGDNAPLMRCVVSRESGSFYEDDWDLADNSQRYADAIKAQLKQDLNSAKDGIDQAIVDATNASKGYTDEAKAVIQQSINALEQNKADLSAVYEKAIVDGMVNDAEAEAIRQANEVAQAQRAALEARVNAYADGQISEAEQRAIDEADRLVEEAKKEFHASITATKNTIDQTISDVQGAMTSYTDEAKQALQASITQLEQAKANVDDVYSKTLIDGKVTALEEFATNEATEYAKAAREAAETNVKAWADGVIDEAEQNAINEAQKKVDAAKENLEEAMDALEGNLTTLINNTKSDLDDAISKAKNEAESNANSYTDKGKEALQASINALNESKANISSVYLKASEDDTISDVEARAIVAAKAEADAAILVSEEIIKAYADDIVSAEEEARIAEAQSNLAAAKKYAEEKADEAFNDAEDLVDNLEGGKENLLRNTGFFGDYVSASLLGEVVLSETSEMYSPSLQHWTSSLATAVEMSESESGKGVRIENGGFIQQSMFHPVNDGEKYVFSFRGKGGSIKMSVGQYSKTFTLSSSFGLYFEKFVANGSTRIIKIEATGTCDLCELQLERGTIRSAWGMSPLDNQSAQAQYESMTYLKQAIEDGSSEFVGGLALANLLFAKDMSGNVKAGMSGIYNDDHSVAFFGGGNYEQAISTALKYANNPSYQASESEIQNMAKFVVTHGGRAILNDVVLRGYIYALGGRFKGIVEATDGKFRGEVEATSGTFNNVSFQSGFIGGFRVSGSGIINQIGENTFDNDAYIRLKNTSEDTEATIGSNVALPSTGRKLLARFVNENDKLSQYSSLPNECFEVGAKGAIDNVAISIDGGCIEGLAYRTYTVSGNSTSNIPKNVTEVLCTNTQIINVYLPSLDVYDDGHVVRVTRTGSEFWLYPFDCNTLNSFEPVTKRTLIYHDGNYYSYSNPISIKSLHTCELVWHRDFSKTINGVEYRGVWILTA